MTRESESLIQPIRKLSPLNVIVLSRLRKNNQSFYFSATKKSFMDQPFPFHLRTLTEAQLRAFDGSDPHKPLLVAVNGRIFDVTPSRLLYGPGGPYALFAGRDATRALALMSFEAKDLTGNTEGLNASELETLHDWEVKFLSKYAEVGKIANQTSCADHDENKVSEEAGAHSGTPDPEVTQPSVGEGSAILKNA